MVGKLDGNWNASVSEVARMRNAIFPIQSGQSLARGRAERTEERVHLSIGGKGSYRGTRSVPTTYGRRSCSSDDRLIDASAR